MIIFDLDCLADDSHRRHFIEAPEDLCGLCYEFLIHTDPDKDFSEKCLCGRQPGIWRKDVQAYNDACDKDEPFKSVIELFRLITVKYDQAEIWTGRCESTREKIITWLIENTKGGIDEIDYFDSILKMRPIADNSPLEDLWDNWIEELLKKDAHHKFGTGLLHPNKYIEMVFTSDQSVKEDVNITIFSFLTAIKRVFDANI